jgi:hypothetical protein
MLGCAKEDVDYRGSNFSENILGLVWGVDAIAFKLIRNAGFSPG